MNRNDFVRIKNKGTARRLFNDGKTVYLIPCKDDMNSSFSKMTPINKEKNQDTFDHLVNDYEWYNCYAEVGYYAHYYVKKGEW